MSDYDDNTTMNYVEQDGGYCPECGQTEPMMKRPNMTDCQDISVIFQCHACKARWKAWYRLVDVECVDAGEHHDQTDMFQNTG